MLPNEDYMRTLRREKKNQAINAEVRARFVRLRDEMLQSFAGLSTEEKLLAFQEVSALMSAKISGF